MSDSELREAERIWLESNDIETLNRYNRIRRIHGLNRIGIPGERPAKLTAPICNKCGAEMSPASNEIATGWWVRNPARWHCANNHNNRYAYKKVPPRFTVERWYQRGNSWEFDSQYFTEERARRYVASRPYRCRIRDNRSGSFIKNTIEDHSE